MKKYVKWTKYNTSKEKLMLNQKNWRGNYY